MDGGDRMTKHAGLPSLHPPKVVGSAGWNLELKEAE